MSNVTAYNEIVAAIDEYYNVSSTQVWDIINQYNLTPEQLAELVPTGPVLAQDGVYKILATDGSVNNYVHSATLNIGNGNAAQSIFNSNTQTGAAAVTEKVQFAGNSVIDQNGKIVTSPNVTKYTSGVAGTTKAVVGSVVGGVAAAAAGLSLGKKIDSALYSANPTFWDSLGLSSLDPTTWASITSDMSDTGVEGAFKTAFNFLFGIDSNGDTQAYMSADAYKYMAYALAKQGVFDSGGKQSSGAVVTGLSNSRMIQYFNAISQPVYFAESASLSIQFDQGSGSQRYQRYEFNASRPVWIIHTNLSLNPTGLNRFFVFCSDQDFSYTLTWSYSGNGVNWSTPSASTINKNSVFDGGNTWYAGSIGSLYEVGGITTVPEVPLSITGDGRAGMDGYKEGKCVWAYVIGTGTISGGGGVDGITDQTGATIPTGISSNSTQQQVADAIDSQYPDLYDNRIEQTVVQPDGTTKTIIYYPVPMPNSTTDTTTTESKNVTTDQPVKIILPNGVTITLPDGTVVTGDGVTPITLPPGTYTLPAGTTITNNYITNITDGDGGTQADTKVTDNSTETLLQTIINILTNAQPQTATDTETKTDSPTDNPTDTGDGSTPPVVVPTGSASALWSVYNPSLSEINSFGAWLWSSNFIDQLLKMFNDPMQAIIGLHKTFIPPVTGARQNIQVGYLDSGVSSLTIPTQYSEVDCGTVQLSEYFGNVFDYDPYTRVYIYLPFIGFRELDVSQVMRSTIGVKYHGDAYTGACLAEISVTRDAGAGGVLYTYSGDCAVRYPLSQGSYMGIVNAIASLAVGAVSVATGAGGLGMVGALGMAQRARTSVERSGAFDGNSGAMGIKKPYLVVMRPQTAMPSNYKHFSGQPSSSKVTVGSTSGLIRVRECHVDSIPYATREEKAMIDSALHDGILVS